MVHHNAYMAKNAAITVRLPEELKRRLAQRAKRAHRSISAQVQHELEQAVAQERTDPAEIVPAVGMFSGARLPSDDDLNEVRASLWGSLGRRHG